MIFTEMKNGQGLGNQLFCYVTTRVIASDKGVEFGLSGLENLGDRRYNDSGLYFMDLYLGEVINPDKKFNLYTEKETRFKINNSNHDLRIGCDVRNFDPGLVSVGDDTELEGVMQSEEYFYHRRDEIKEWLKIKPEHDCYDFSHDDICVINFRDYKGNGELYLSKKYWVDSTSHMRKIKPSIKFIVITENVECAREMLGEITNEIYHFDVGKDYSIVKNAKWLILSNSSFGIFPAWTSETAKMIIAPKYWARHNVSNGYWSCGYNLYRDWFYMDREGILFSYLECKSELEKFMHENSHIYTSSN
jgi:hypothetical protein